MSLRDGGSLVIGKEEIREKPRAMVCESAPKKTLGLAQRALR